MGEMLFEVDGAEEVGTMEVGCWCVYRAPRKEVRAVQFVAAFVEVAAHGFS